MLRFSQKYPCLINLVLEQIDTLGAPRFLRDWLSSLGYKIDPRHSSIPLGCLDVCNLIPNLRVENGAEVVAELAVEIVKFLIRLIAGSNLDTAMLFKRSDVIFERLRKTDKCSVFEPACVVVDRKKDSNVVGRVGHPSMPKDVLVAA